MQKLSSTLNAESYYDDDLAELYHQHDNLHGKLREVNHGYRLRLQDLQDGAVTFAAGIDPAQMGINSPTARRVALHAPDPEQMLASVGSSRPGSKAAADPAVAARVRQRVAAVVRRLARVPTSPLPGPIIAERVAAEVDAVAEPQAGLDSVRARLLAFFARRRSALALQCDLISGRAARFVRDWTVSQRVTPTINARVRLLQQEIEACDSRLRRLRPLRLARDGRPIGQSSTGTELFSDSGPYNDGTLSCVFRSDIAVCIRGIMTEERSTRALRRFLQRMQHLPVTHREELWRRVAGPGAAVAGLLHATALALPVTSPAIVGSAELVPVSAIASGAWRGGYAGGRA